MKKFVAVLATAFLALGLTGLGALPAAAAQNTISGEATCDNGMVTIFWTVTNSEPESGATILQSDGSPAINWVGYTIGAGSSNTLKQHGISTPGKYTVSIKAQWDNDRRDTSGDSGTYTVTRDDIQRCAPDEPKLIDVKQPLKPYLEPVCGVGGDGFGNDVWITGGDPEGIEWKKSYDAKTGVHLLWAEALSGYRIVAGETHFEGLEDTTECVQEPPRVTVTPPTWTNYTCDRSTGTVNPGTLVITGTGWKFSFDHKVGSYLKDVAHSIAAGTYSTADNKAWKGFIGTATLWHGSDAPYTFTYSMPTDCAKDVAVTPPTWTNYTCDGQTLLDGTASVESHEDYDWFAKFEHDTTRTTPHGTYSLKAGAEYILNYDSFTSSEFGDYVGSVTLRAVSNNSAVQLTGTLISQFTFTKPDCAPPVVFPTCQGSTSLPWSTDLDAQGWVSLGGVYEVDGMRFNSASDGYVYWELPTPRTLSELASVSFDATPDYGGLIFYNNDNSVNVHYEPYYSDPLWTNIADVLPRNNPNPGNNNGQGGPYSGSFDDLLSNPVVHYVAFWVNGGHDVTLHSLRFNCMTQNFGAAALISIISEDDLGGDDTTEPSNPNTGDGNSGTSDPARSDFSGAGGDTGAGESTETGESTGTGDSSGENTSDGSSSTREGTGTYSKATVGDGSDATFTPTSDTSPALWLATLATLLLGGFLALLIIAGYRRRRSADR